MVADIFSGAFTDVARNPNVAKTGLVFAEQGDVSNPGITSATMNYDTGVLTTTTNNNKSDESDGLRLVLSAVARLGARRARAVHSLVTNNCLHTSVHICIGVWKLEVAII